MTRKIYKVPFGKKNIIIQSKADSNGYEAFFEHEGMLCFASVVDLEQLTYRFIKSTECMIFPVDETTHEIDFGTELYINRTDSKDMLWFIKQCIDDFTEEYHAS